MTGAVVFDVGGTSLRSGMLTPDGSLREVERVSAPNFLQYPFLSVEQLQAVLLRTLVERVRGYERRGWLVGAVGVSFPGPVTRDGTVCQAPTLWGRKAVPFPLAERLSAELPGKRVLVVNDITAAGHRYLERFGGTCCVITVSSGVGNKVFWQGEVLLNEKGLGGEIGHLPVGAGYEEFVCDCGGSGHLGAVASGRGAQACARRLRETRPDLFRASMLRDTETITTHDLVRGIERGDAFAEEVLRMSIRPLVRAILSVHALIGIERYVLIGGFAVAVGDAYVEEVKRQIKELRPFGLSDQEVESMIHLGEADDDHGLIGMGICLERKGAQ